MIYQHQGYTSMRLNDEMDSLVYVVYKHFSSHIHLISNITNAYTPCLAI